MLIKRLIYFAAISFSIISHAEGVQHYHQITPLNNFTQFKSGEEYCDNQKAQNPNVQSCIPIVNENSHAVINLQSIYSDPNEAVNPGSIFDVNSYHKINSFHVIVTNAETNKVIYSGSVLDMLGIACDYAYCKPWK